MQEAAGTVGVISGTYGKVKGATQGDYVPTTILDVDLKPDIVWHLSVDSLATLFIYIVEGAGAVCEPATQVIRRRAVLFGDGDEFAVQAGSDGMRFVLCAGRPLHEPIAWGGPIVMNTQEELDQAFDELDKGTFIR